MQTSLATHYTPAKTVDIDYSNVGAFAFLENDNN